MKIVLYNSFKPYLFHCTHHKTAIQKVVHVHIYPFEWLFRLNHIPHPFYYDKGGTGCIKLNFILHIFPIKVFDIVVDFDFIDRQLSVESHVK